MPESVHGRDGYATFHGDALAGWAKMANLAEDGAQQVAAFAIFILSQSP